MNFRAWLRTAEATDDAAGDLIKDMRQDIKEGGELPNGDINELRSYLLYRGACDGALNALDVVWQRYRSSEAEPMISHGSDRVKINVELWEQQQADRIAERRHRKWLDPYRLGIWNDEWR